MSRPGPSKMPFVGYFKEMLKKKVSLVLKRKEFAFCVAVKI